VKTTGPQPGPGDPWTRIRAVIHEGLWVLLALFSAGRGRAFSLASTVLVMSSDPVVDRIKEQGCPECGSHQLRAGMDDRDDLVSLVCDSCLNAWSVEVPPPA
jgi:hypothetical protein